MYEVLDETTLRKIQVKIISARM